jgi:hypothetical protein
MSKPPRDGLSDRWSEQGIVVDAPRPSATRGRTMLRGAREARDFVAAALLAMMQLGYLENDIFRVRPVAWRYRGRYRDFDARPYRRFYYPRYQQRYYYYPYAYSYVYPYSGYPYYAYPYSGYGYYGAPRLGYFNFEISPGAVRVGPRYFWR